VEVGAVEELGHQHGGVGGGAAGPRPVVGTVVEE
jgi:hypothetical protein